MCMLLSVKLFGVAVFHTYMVNWIGGYICPHYMCILIYVKHIWGSCISLIYGELEDGEALALCAFCYM